MSKRPTKSKAKSPKAKTPATESGAFSLKTEVAGTTASVVVVPKPEPTPVPPATDLPPGHIWDNSSGRMKKNAV